MMETDKRIQHEIEKASIDSKTGIRHGVISQYSILEEAFDKFDFDYGKPRCPKCNDEVPRDGLGPFGFFCLRCNLGIREEDAYLDLPLGFYYDEDGYALADYLGNDILVLRSNFYTYTQLSSPRVQGYGNLDNPVKDGVKTYALGHEWFKGEVAPYPVYRVSDGLGIAPNFWLVEKVLSKISEGYILGNLLTFVKSLPRRINGTRDSAAIRVYPANSKYQAGMRRERRWS